jgi:hypothetical protein
LRGNEQMSKKMATPMKLKFIFSFFEKETSKIRSTINAYSLRQRIFIIKNKPANAHSLLKNAQSMMAENIAALPSLVKNTLTFNATSQI